MNMKNVLAIGAHPDDLEVGCFGTLLKHKMNGDKVHVAITTQGGCGHRTLKIMDQEHQRSMKILKPHSVINFENPNGQVKIGWKTVSEIDGLIKRYDIDTIYTLWYGDSHQDHQETFRIVMAACRKGRVDNVYCCELGNYVFHAQVPFRPQLFVDISDTIDDKMKAIGCYRSYFSPEDLESIKSLNKYRGSCCRSDYAEAFEIIREVKRV
jgi:N-acetylglucosamine malate deacetylase 1